MIIQPQGICKAVTSSALETAQTLEIYDYFEHNIRQTVGVVVGCDIRVHKLRPMHDQLARIFHATQQSLERLPNNLHISE